MSLLTQANFRGKFYRPGAIKSEAKKLAKLKMKAIKLAKRSARRKNLSAR
jgi:hypothetical protein